MLSNILPNPVGYYRTCHPIPAFFLFLHFENPENQIGPQLSNEGSTEKTYVGPMTWSRAKQIQQEVNALLADHISNIHENFILPKSCVLTFLRYNVEDKHQLSAHEETSSAREETSSATLATSLKKTSFTSDVKHVLVTRATSYASRKNSKPSQPSTITCTVLESIPELFASCHMNV